MEVPTVNEFLTYQLMQLNKVNFVYEGPEVQASGEEDRLLPKKEYFSSQLSLARLDPAPSAFDDDYDEIEEEEEEPQTERIIMERMQAQGISSTGMLESQISICYVSITAVIERNMPVDC